ncbi:class F sortase [Actinoplanes sp. G11-F43]|uniref:class F sortase n=1 Tax=Actinoplanes sp. G11-F43 TaxID=3424130 RepID=UPI003D33260C
MSPGPSVGSRHTEAVIAALERASIVERSPRFRDPRAAALAVALAVLGVLTTVLGLTTEDAAPPPAASTGAEIPGSTTAPAPEGEATASGVTTEGVTTEEGTTEASAAPDDDTDGPADGDAGGMARSVPVRLRIPAIEVNTELMSLGLRADGTLQVPPLRGDAPAGWYRHSPTPGEAGASVIAGHVDTARDGAAVFYRLRELGVGDRVEVRRKDGSTARFAVTRVAVFAKRDFPSDQVYATVPHAGLRLITCGGVFDRGEGSYRSNVVVFADAVT